MLQKNYYIQQKQAKYDVGRISNDVQFKPQFDFFLFETNEMRCFGFIRFVAHINISTNKR